MFGTSLGRTTLLAFLSQQSAPTARQATKNFSQTPLAATKYLLKYEYVPDVLEKRGPYREGHLGLAKKLVEEGRCLSGGPSGQPGNEVPSGAMFVFTDLESAEFYAKGDPYVQNGIVTSYSIEEWNVVIEKE